MCLSRAFSVSSDPPEIFPGANCCNVPGIFTALGASESPGASNRLTKVKTPGVVPSRLARIGAIYFENFRCSEINWQQGLCENHDFSTGKMKTKMRGHGIHVTGALQSIHVNMQTDRSMSSQVVGMHRHLHKGLPVEPTNKSAAGIETQKRSAMAEPKSPLDPHGYAPSGRRCEDSHCAPCGTTASLEWKSGFCQRGHWAPKPLPTAPLEPLWRDLPRELLNNIFARLPTAGIGRTRTLSRDWRAATATSSLFTRHCAHLHRNLLAMVGFRTNGTCWVRALDLTTRKWHAYDIPSVPALYRNAIRVFDGGLACFVPCGLASHHDPILILNPLTREHRLLPLPKLVGNLPRMAQLKVNPHTATYEVTLVGHVGLAPDLHHRWEENAPLAAEVYDSTKNAWTPSPSGETLGFTYWWYKHSPTPMSMHLSLYNAATGRLSELHPRGDATFAHHLDELFLLQSWPGRVRVVRRGGVGGTHEVVESVSSWKCHGFGTLRVCEGFFLMLGSCEEGANFMMVYDRERRAWAEFAFDSKGGSCISPMDLYEFGIGELSWGARP